MTVASTGPIFGVPTQFVNTGEQAMIELVYVKTANDVLTEKMASMENALSITTDVMNSLTAIQTAHNQLQATSRQVPTFNYANSAGGVDQYTSAYTTYASQAFGVPINPTFIYSSATAPGFANFQADLISTKNTLISQISQLSAITPALSNGQPDPNALLAKLKNVLADLNKYDLTTYSGVKSWVIDNYDMQGTSSSSKAGAIQQNITSAITAGQSLNDTQKETVRRFLYLFEEYYKSASAILTKITQIIEKMAQGISR